MTKKELIEKWVMSKNLSEFETSLDEYVADCKLNDESWIYPRNDQRKPPLYEGFYEYKCPDCGWLTSSRKDDFNECERCNQKEREKLDVLFSVATKRVTDRFFEKDGWRIPLTERIYHLIGGKTRVVFEIRIDNEATNSWEKFNAKL